MPSRLQTLNPAPQAPISLAPPAATASSRGSIDGIRAGRRPAPKTRGRSIPARNWAIEMLDLDYL